MIVYKLRNKTFPKTCIACPLFCRTFGVPAYCKVGGKYTEEEIENEKDGNLKMYHHGCLNNRPKKCPLKEIER